uniref:Uncharacterized protein n=1 Tax=Echinococcus granulosus TaxID=6210 RepID=A0A068WU24_ECHGR|nr:hypothetical protein EgrG_002024400 [Echinococcus granulosus]
MCISCPRFLFNLWRSLEELHRWQRKAHSTLKVIYHDFCWAINLGGAEEIRVLRMGESVMTPSRKVRNDISLQQLPQSYDVQESYPQLKRQ